MVNVIELAGVVCCAYVISKGTQALFPTFTEQKMTLIMEMMGAGYGLYNKEWEIVFLMFVFAIYTIRQIKREAQHG